MLECGDETVRGTKDWGRRGDGGFVCWRESIKGDATNLGSNASCHLVTGFCQGRVTFTRNVSYSYPASAVLR